MSQPTNPIAKLTHFIEMRDLNVPVFNLDGVEYVPARDLVEYAGLTWRSALANIQLPEHKILYGTETINVALYTGFRHASMTKTDLPPTKNAENDDNSTEETLISAYKNLEVKPLVCFQLTLAWGYLNSISVRHMKAQGKVEAAERLIQIKKEWSKVIHDYELEGIAVNPVAKDWASYMKTLLTIESMAKQKEQKLAIEKKINEALGIRPQIINEPQPDLFI